MAEVTPMMRQYHNIKEQNSDCILFFRLGDFYEMFDEDAILVSKELDLTLTTRDRSKENPEDRTPMCGVPYHSCEAYIARLVAKGYKIAICEQTEDPAQAKGLVSREVIRVITPGTVIDSSMLDEGKATYISSVYLEDDNGGKGSVCFIDISTGEICATAFSSDAETHIVNEMGRFSPSEVLLCKAASDSEALSLYYRQHPHCLTQTMDFRFEFKSAQPFVLNQFSAETAEDLGNGSRPEIIRAVGALLSYLIETQKTDLKHLNVLRVYTVGDYMELDITTHRNLELIESLRSGEKRGSLLWVLDKTKTSMGSRLLRSWISRPLLSPVAIKRRLDAVEELVKDTVARSELALVLKEISDIERIIGKASYGTANGRDMRALSMSLEYLPKLRELITLMQSARMQSLSSFDPLEDIRELIDISISDEPPFSIREGGIIRDGYDSEVDRLRGLLHNSSGALTDVEKKERERTGKKLKVGFNRVFGYYIEIPRSMSEDVPANYIRKQTLTNCERFITQELKELENILLTAKDTLEELEYNIFTKIRQQISQSVERVQATAAAVAEIDVLTCFAQVASARGYVKPEMDDSTTVEIIDGRHPVVEATQPDCLFVPNDTRLNTSDCRCAIITGPNMAGKSTYMRQTALIILMAQTGSFVPAKSARLGVVDRVFTRIGASDDLAGGRSTFMVEMSEVAQILKNATSRSLILLDEIGRGTSTYDGMSIARAVVEYCANSKKLGAKTMFATHYHELTDLEDEINGVKNYNIAAKKRGSDVIFLRKIVPGGADDSYGIEVARLAGVPESVIRRAKTVLKTLESDERGTPSLRGQPEQPGDSQVSLMQVAGDEAAEILRSTDLNTISPLEAMNLLFELKKKVD